MCNIGINSRSARSHLTPSVMSPLMFIIAVLLTRLRPGLCDITNTLWSVAREVYVEALNRGDSYLKVRRQIEVVHRVLAQTLTGKEDAFGLLQMPLN